MIWASGGNGGVRWLIFSGHVFGQISKGERMMGEDCLPEGRKKKKAKKKKKKRERKKPKGAKRRLNRRKRARRWGKGH